MQNQIIEGYQLSPQQKHLWVLQQFDSNSAYRAQCAVLIEGPLDAEHLRATVEQVVNRHDILRTTFRSLPEMTTPLQVTANSGIAWGAAQDWTTLDACERESASRALFDEMRGLSIDLESGPFLHLSLAAVAPGEHMLFICLPALCADSMTLKNLVREVCRAYRAGTTDEVPDEETMQYVVASEWLNELLESEDGEDGRAYWRKLAQSAPHNLKLPFEQQPSSASEFSPASFDFGFDKETTGKIELLVRKYRTSTAEFLLACWQVLLWRQSGQTEVVVGTAFNGRTDEELEQMCGPLTKYLPVQSRLHANTRLPEILKSLRAAFSDSFTWQECFTWEQFAAKNEGVLAQPFEPFCFDFEEQVTAETSDGLRFSMQKLRTHVDCFKLKLSCTRHADALLAEFHYDAALFPADDIRKLSAQFEKLVKSAVRNPQEAISRFEYLGDAEKQQVLVEFNDTKVDFKTNKTIVELFEEQAALTPLATALVYEDTSLTYAELNRRANQLAHYLIGAGVSTDSLVGVCLHRSPEMVIALLATLKAGGAYVPLDPEYPHERIAYMLRDTRATVLLTQQELLAQLPEHDGRVVCVDAQWPEIEKESAQNPAVTVSGENLAYVIYTSGSTGTPKGVMISHRAIANHMLWMSMEFPLTSEDAVLQKTPSSFDASVWEFYAPLLSGARLVVARAGGHREADYLVEVIKREGVTVLQVVPSLLRMLLKEEGIGECRSLRRVYSGGEALGRELVEEFHEQLIGAEIYNLYGPTEATIDATCWRCGSNEQERAVSIGKPVANTEVYILDAGMDLVGVRMSGEIYISGAGLARGYVGRGELTAEKFVPHPFSAREGARLYRTGDLGRWREDGRIEFQGRVDHQVKVRGFLVEVGEVESVLSQHPSVKTAVVVALEGEGGEKRLAAYIVGDAKQNLSIEELRRHLKEKLPEYMVPAFFVMLDAMPLAPNGKIDRAALPAPGTERSDLVGAYEAPRYDEEEVLAAIWAQVLGVEKVGIRDNFFALGGDSIRSVRVVSMAKERGLNCSVQQLFEHQTISELARALSLNSGNAVEKVRLEAFGLLSTEDRQKLQDGLEDAYPLTMLQQGMLYHMELTPDTPIYHNVSSWHLRARLEPEALRTSVQRAVDRHPNLRTSFDIKTYSEPLQLVHREAQLPVEIDDLRHLDPDEQERAIAAYVTAESKRPFDFSRPPLLRLHIHRRSDETFQFSLTEFHPIFDGWSLTSTLAEIFNNYFALIENAALPIEQPPTASFRDYVQMERMVLESEECKQFWDETLRDCTPLVLPRWPSLVQTNGARMHHKPFQITGETLDGLKRLAKLAAVPMKDVLLSAHVKVMSLVSGQTDVLTGLSANNTRPEDVDGDEIRGLFINTLPLRMKLAEGTWVDLARETFEAERRMLPYRLYPLAVLQKKWGRQRLLETSFNYVHFHSVKTLFESGNVEIVGPGNGVELSSFTLQVNFSLNPMLSMLKMVLSCDGTQLYDEQVTAIADCYVKTLHAMAHQPHSSHTAFQPLEMAAEAETSGVFVDLPKAVEFEDNFLF